MAPAVGRAERLLALALLLFTALLCGPGHGVLVHPSGGHGRAESCCAARERAPRGVAAEGEDKDEDGRPGGGSHLGASASGEHDACLLCALTGAPRAPERPRVSVPALGELAIEGPVTEVRPALAARAPTSRGPPRAG